MHEYYTIGQLTRAFGITARTLRYYEDEGLLKPFRRGRTRLYTPSDHSRLRRILRAKRFNFSLDEIRSLLNIGIELNTNVDAVERELTQIQKLQCRLRKLQQDIRRERDELTRLEEVCFERLAELRVRS